MFIARISKGRTIRQFVIYVILVPSLVSFIWFAILGGSAINLQLNEGWDPPLTDTGGIALESSLFETLREFPLSGITVALAVFLVAIFFVTGADAASIVMGMLSQNGKEEPLRALVIFWGVADRSGGCRAAVGAEGQGLAALQTLVIIVAGPFMLILIGMCFSLMRELRREPDEALMPDTARRFARKVVEIHHPPAGASTESGPGPESGDHQH